MSKLKDYTRVGHDQLAYGRPAREEPLCKIIKLKDRHMEAYTKAFQKLINEHAKYKEYMFKHGGVIPLRFVDTKHLHDLIEYTEQEIKNGAEQEVQIQGNEEKPQARQHSGVRIDVPNISGIRRNK